MLRTADRLTTTRLPLAAALLLAAAPWRGLAAPRIEVSDTPRPTRGFAGTLVPTGDAPGRFRPKRRFAAVLSAMANPPSWRRPGRMGLGVWVEHPDRPPSRPYLPHVLHAGDRVHGGTRGLARVDLPGRARVYLAAESVLKVSGDGAYPRPRQRVRIGVEPGLAWIQTPRGRPLEVEVSYGLVHLEFGELLVDLAEKTPREAKRDEWAKLHLVSGRAKLHGRGRYRRGFARLLAGQTLAYGSPDPVYWRAVPSDANQVADVKGFFLPLEPGELREVEEPPPLAITQPRPFTGLVTTRPVSGAPGGPGGKSATPRPGPGGPPAGPPPTRPAPTRSPRPPKNPFVDPFPDDKDPFGDGVGIKDPDDPFAGDDEFDF